MKMNDNAVKQRSLALYRYLCQHIVGTEETIKAKRLLITAHDDLMCDEEIIDITSGSFGEGLEMKGSDFDYMYVVKCFPVYEQKSDIKLDLPDFYFEINTDYTKLGFVRLQLPENIYNIPNLCVKAGGSLFLSNSLFKLFFRQMSILEGKAAYMTAVNHGPCLSDENGLFDFAICLHSSSWIGHADNWMTRSKTSWPGSEVVSRIIDHGILFVPIGVKGSRNEDIEWRISFSVGEKILIYSFTHTQLLCYALLKIVLKDIISTDIKCKDLLCSYYLKNILFWVSEEMPLTEWKSDNLIYCFMQCFKRLLYCVEYSVCPHYFISKINMFEDKIEAENRRILLDKLYSLHDFGWRCISFSPQFLDLFSNTYIPSTLCRPFVDSLEQIICSSVLTRSDTTETLSNYNKAVKVVSSYRSQRYPCFLFSEICLGKAQRIQLSYNDRNKIVYRKYKVCQCYLLQGLYRDAVSGWLQVASLYYKTKQYTLALHLSAYSLSKCSKDKIYRSSKLSSVQRCLPSSNIFQRKGLFRMLHLVLLKPLDFIKKSTIIPKELELDSLTNSFIVPPEVFARFLCFLCHYHLGAIRECRNSLTELIFTVSENYIDKDISVCCNIIGVAYQMIGEYRLAKETFRYAVKLDPIGVYSSARQRLSVLDI